MIIGKKVIFVLIIGLSIIIASCNSSITQSPEGVVESYLLALIDKDQATISTLSCGDWEMDALMELDSLQAVEVQLEDLKCENIGSEDDFSIVNCKGYMVASYNGENQKIDLSLRNYRVIKSGNEYLMCGYK